MIQRARIPQGPHRNSVVEGTEKVEGAEKIFDSGIIFIAQIRRTGRLHRVGNAFSQRQVANVHDRRRGTVFKGVLGYRVNLGAVESVGKQAKFVGRKVHSEGVS